MRWQQTLAVLVARCGHERNLWRAFTGLLSETHVRAGKTSFLGQLLPPHAASFLRLVKNFGSRKKCWFLENNASVQRNGGVFDYLKQAMLNTVLISTNKTELSQSTLPSIC